MPGKYLAHCVYYCSAGSLAFDLPLLAPSWPPAIYVFTEQGPVSPYTAEALEELGALHRKGPYHSSRKIPPHLLACVENAHNMPAQHLAHRMLLLY